MDYPGIFRGKIEDVPVLRNELVSLWQTKSKRQISAYGIRLAEWMQSEYFADDGAWCEAVIAVNLEWQEGQAPFQKGRNLAGEINALAKSQPRQRDLALRTLAQIACIPHTERHGMWASDYMVKVVNETHPCDLERVKEVRQRQIDLIRDC